MSRFSAPIAEQIWDMTYRLRENDGTVVDQSVEDSRRCIAQALAAEEAEPSVWEEKFYAALEDFKFLPEGRITAGAGTERAVTLFDCFVMGTIQDTMPGIFDALKEAALTMQRVGGIGYDFSTTRPKGAPVHGVATDASGPLSFMDVWDAIMRSTYEYAEPGVIFIDRINQASELAYCETIAVSNPRDPSTVSRAKHGRKRLLN